MNKFGLLVLFGLCLGFSGISQASHKELYTNKYHFNVGALYSDMEALSLSGESSDDSDVGTWFSVGFSPNKNLGFEAEYYNLGELYNERPSGSQQNKVDSDAFGFSVIGRSFLTDRFLMFGSLGAAQVNLEYFDATSEHSFIKDDDVALRFGIGFEYFAYKVLTIGLDFKKIKADILETSSIGLFFKYVL